jgi:hypothetical protein
MTAVSRILVLLAALAIAPAAAEERGTIPREGAFGCHDRALFDRMAAINASGEKQASYDLMFAALGDGRCAYFGLGAEVTISKRNPTGDRLCLRRAGAKGCLWTSSAAFRAPDRR